MRRSLATLSVLLFCCGLSVLQAAATDTSKNLLLLGVGGSGSAIIPSGYQGPADVIGSADRFYSFGRAYNNAYAAAAGTLAVLVDSAAPTTPICTLRSLSTGYVDLTAYCVGSVTPATKCAAATGGVCNIWKWTDQSGNGDDLVMATAVSQPKLGFSVLDSLPCADFTSSSSSIYMASAGGALTQAVPFNFMAIAARTADPTVGNQIVSSGTNAAPYIQYRSSANSIALSAGTQIQTSSGTTDGTFYALIGVVDLAANTDSVLVVNGAVQAGPSSAGSTGFTSGQLVVGHIASQTSGMKECELGVWPGTAWTSTQYGNMNTNMRSATNGWGAF